MLKELFFLIKKYSKDNFIKSQAEFMDWFLGNQTSYGNTMLKYLYKEERRLELKNRIKISKNAEWELSKFDDVKNLKNEMKGLFENVFKMSSDELGLNQMLRAFLNQYLFEAIYPEKIFEEYTGQVCHNHIYEKKYTSFFGEAWETSNIVVIYGKGGIGKTQLVKSYLQENKGYYKEICVVDDFMSVKEALLGIPFLINDKKNIEETIHILKEKSNDSVIAIDIPDLKKEDIELIGKLIGLELRVIIITHQKLPIENIYQKQLNSLEDETLRKIFDVNVDKKDFIMSEEQFEKLLDIVERNTLVIALLGKCLGKKDGHIPMDELLNEDEWIWNKTKLKTVHASEYGQKEGKTPIRHIIAILDKYCVTEADKIVEYIRFLDMVEFPELKMKTQLEITYWRMLYLINNATSKEEVRKVIDEFEILKKEYQNKIFPIDVELLFGEVEVLKSALEQDRDTLCESVKNLSSVFEKRVEMKVTSHEIKRIQEVVPEIIERIQNFPL